MSKWTAQRIRAAKGMRKLPCLTAYDYITAKLVDAAGIPLVLVGDSLAMTVLGYETTLPATMTEMLHHTAAVARGTREALVVADMPFLSFQVSVESAIANAGRFLKEAGADAVKIEGGALRAPTVRALVQNGIPVLGHIGITPQSIREMGGYKVRGAARRQPRRCCATRRRCPKPGSSPSCWSASQPSWRRKSPRRRPFRRSASGPGRIATGRFW